jgi:hypothetical protein
VIGGSGVVVTVVVVVVVVVIVVPVSAEGALTEVLTTGSATGARGCAAGVCVTPRPALGADRAGADP